MTVPSDEERWGTDVKKLVFYISEHKPKRITRYEIDEIIDPGGIRRTNNGKYLGGSYVPDAFGNRCSDDMYCFLLENVQLINKESYESTATPKWVLNRYKRSSKLYIGDTDESWEINYSCDVLTKHSKEMQKNCSCERQIKQLIERIIELERVLFVAIEDEVEITELRNPWVNSNV